MIKLDKLERLRYRKTQRFTLKYLQYKSNANSADSIPLNSFHNFFSDLENEIFQTVNDDVKSVCVNNTFNVNANNENEELDFPITVEEKLSAIKQLKRNKAIDSLLNEYFIECSDILSPYLCKLLNAVLQVVFQLCGLRVQLFHCFKKEIVIMQLITEASL